MAYMNQEKKAVIAAALKPVMPKGWKYSLAVDNHSTIVLNITAAPVDLLKLAREAGYSATLGYVQVNPHCMNQHFKNTEVAELFAKIQAALFGADYFDHSDIMIDYHHTAYYVNVNVGKWNKPFQHLA